MSVWMDRYTIHAGCASKKDLSPGFLLIHDLYCVVVDLPQLLQIHAVQLLNDADGEGVSQLVSPLSRWRELPCLCAHVASFGWGGGGRKKGWGHPERRPPKK